MVTPGIPVDQVLRRLEKDVVRLAKSVNHDQVLALYDRTVGEFSLSLSNPSNRFFVTRLRFFGNFSE